MQGRTPARVVVLGGTGFLGQEVTRNLLMQRHQVRLLVRDPERVRTIIPPGTKILAGDATDQQSLMTACQGAEYVVSMVALRRNQAQSMLEVNVDAAKRLADACKRTGVKGIVYVSSVGAELDLRYKYLSSRFMGEEELRQSKIPTAILRFTLLLGPDGGIVRDLDRIVRSAPVVVLPRGGQNRFQPILRDDAARCVAEAVGRTDLEGKTLNLGGPEILTFEQLLELYMEARGVRKRVFRLPPHLLLPVAHVMEMYMKRPLVVPDELRSIQLDNLADGLDAVMSNFGFRPQPPSDWIPRNWREPIAA